MKYFGLISALAIATFMLTACTEEEEPEQTQEYQSLQISETMSNDGGTVKRLEDYYNDVKSQKLVRYVTTQTFSEFSIENTSTISYANNEATVTDAFGNISVYTLNSYGFATRCTRHEGETLRTYTFEYSGNNPETSLLTGITEFINEERFSNIALDFTDAHNALLTVEVQDAKNTYQLSFNTPNTSRLPWLYLTGVHPLTLHKEAIYAHLLGELPMYLLDSIYPVGSNEETIYSYTNDANGQLSSCSETTHSQGGVYRRTVAYTVTPAL